MSEFKVSRAELSDVSRKYGNAISNVSSVKNRPVAVKMYLTLMNQRSLDISTIKNNISYCSNEINTLYSDLIALRNGIEAVRTESEEADRNAKRVFKPVSFGGFIRRLIDRLKELLDDNNSIVTTTNNIVSKLREWSEQIEDNRVEQAESTVEEVLVVPLNEQDYDSNESQEIPFVDPENVQPNDDYQKTIENTQNTAYWEAKVGSTVGNITDRDGNFTEYYGSGNISYTNGYEGECTWYAYGRFYELTGIKLNEANMAYRWLSDNQNDPRVKILDVPVAGSIAVNTNRNGAFHVLIVEHVTYDENGNPLDIYFSEANWGREGNVHGKYDVGKDGVLKKLLYSEFIKSKNPSGYIAAA